MPAARTFVPPVFVLLWATGFIGARYAMPHAEPFTFLAVRFAIACALLAAIAKAMGAKPLSWTQARNAMIAGALIHGIYLGGVFWAVHRGLPAGLSALIVGLQPLITALFAGMLLGETITRRHWLGLAIGFTGVAIVLAPKLGASLEGVTVATLAASVVAVVAIAGGTVFQKRTGGQGDLVAGTAWQYVGATALTGLGSLAFEHQEIDWSGPLLFALAWLVLVLSLGAIFLLLLLIREGAMAKVAALFYLVPGVTAVMAWALFGETLTLVQVGGLMVAMAGVWLATGARRSPA